MTVTHRSRTRGLLSVLPLFAVVLAVLLGGPAVATAQDGPPKLAPDTPVDAPLPTAGGQHYLTRIFEVPEGTKSVRVTAVSKDDHTVRVFLRHGQPMPEWDTAHHVGDTTVYVDANSDPALKTGTYYLDVAYAGEAPEGNTVRLLLEFDVDPPEAPELAVDGKLELNEQKAFRLPHPQGRAYMTFTFEIDDDTTMVRVVVNSEQDIDMFIRHGAQMNNYSEAEFMSRGPGECAVTIRRDDPNRPLKNGTYFVDVTFEQSAMQTKAEGSIVVLSNTGQLAVDAILHPRSKHEFALPHDDGRTYLTFVVDAPANVKSVRIIVVGDEVIDLYVRHGAQMQTYSEADYQVVGQSRRDIYIDRWHPTKPVAPGQYFIDVTFDPRRGADSAKGEVLVLIDQDPPVDGRVMPGTALPFNLQARAGGVGKVYYVDVPERVKKVVVETECRADVGLALRRGHWLSSEGERNSDTDDGNERIVLEPADGEDYVRPGRYYVAVMFGYNTGRAEGKLTVTLER